MVLIFGHDIGFWFGILAGLLILLHLPACDYHWADRFGKVSAFLKKHHLLTLRLATTFALIHILLAIMGLGFGIWI